MARAARVAGTIVSADIESINEALPELLPLVDVLVCSREFPQRLTGIADEKTSLLELKARYGSAVVGMTLGNRGALLHCEGQFIEAPAYLVPGGCLDTTGAGDAFRAGLLYGLGGALLAALIIYGGIAYLDQAVGALSAQYGGSFRLTGLGSHGTGQLVAVGVILGWLGAFISTGKHLRRIEPRA